MKLIRAAMFSTASVLSCLAAGHALADGISEGRKLAAAQCQVCHGLDGIATMPVAPNLAGENAIYIQTQLKAFRSGKRENEMMSVVAKELSDADIANLAAWYEAIEITATMPE